MYILYILSNCPYVQSILTDTLNIILDDFCIWLLDYRIEFSCLFIQQRIIWWVICGYEEFLHIFYFTFYIWLG